MTFPPNVERWRSLVKKVLTSLFVQFPDYKSLQDRFIAPNAGGGAILVSPLAEDLILALIQKESSGISEAIGDGGASIGLMQLNYSAGTPQSVGYGGSRDGLFVPEENIYWGSKYFFRQLARYQDVDRAILAYNAGSVRLNAGGLPINLPYLTDVLSFLSEKKTSVSSWRLFLLSLSSGRDPDNADAQAGGLDRIAGSADPNAGGSTGRRDDQSAGGTIVEPKITLSTDTTSADLENVIPITPGDRQDPRKPAHALILGGAIAAIISAIALLIGYC